MSHSGIQWRNLFRLGTRFVFASPYNPRSFYIEFSQIGAGFPTVGSELHRALELTVNSFGQAGRPEKAGVIRFLSADSSQPQVIQSVVGSELSGFLAGGNAGVPGSKLELRAAKKVIGIRCRGVLDLLLEHLHRLIDTPRGEEVLRGLPSEGEGSETQQSDHKAS